MMYEIICCYYDSFYCLYFGYEIQIFRICSNFLMSLKVIYLAIYLMF